MQKYPNLFFSRLNHTNITKKILNLIKNKFDSKVAIRSSSLSEDNFKTSNAGKYDSFLNIEISNTKKLQEKIDQVILSYSGDKILKIMKS